MRAARRIPLGSGGRGFQEIQTLRQEIGILTKHSRPAAPRRGLPPRLTLGPPACRRGTDGVSDTWRGAARIPASELGRGRASCSSAPLPFQPASLPISGSDGICPHKTLALGGAFLRTPTAGKGLGLSVSHPTEDELAISKLFPVFSIKEITLPDCPLSLLPLC